MKTASPSPQPSPRSAGRGSPAVSLEGVTYRYPGTQAGVLEVSLDKIGRAHV